MQTQESYYAMLGVPRDADTKEVKAAYRRLSKVLHPDVSGLPDALERFNLVQKAYKTLIDKDLRRRYDRSLDHGEKPWQDDTFQQFDQGFAGFYNRPATGRPPVDGTLFRHTMEYEISDLLNRRELTIEVKGRDRCLTCSMTGKIKPENKAVCKACAGKGFTVETKRDPVTGSYTMPRRCEDCEGTGSPLTEPCPDCHGEKSVTVKKEVTFTLPGNVHDGMTLRLAGQGGNGLFGGKDGDLLVTLHRREDDPALVTDKGDVLYHMVIPPELFFIGKVTIERFDGKQETCRIATKAGAEHVIKGAGIGGRDVIYRFYPALPPRKDV